MKRLLLFTLLLCLYLTTNAQNCVAIVYDWPAWASENSFTTDIPGLSYSATCAGNCAETGSVNATGVSAGNYSITINDAFGDGWNGGGIVGIFVNGNLIDVIDFTDGSSNTIAFTVDDLPVNSCTPASCDTDGSYNTTTCLCEFTANGDIAGCTNPAAPNYNASATCDDGTCQSPPSCTAVTSGCAGGCVSSYTVTSTNDDGDGSTGDPTSSATFEICYELQSFDETSTNWVHGVYLDTSDPSYSCLAFSVTPGATGAQSGAGSTTGNWIFLATGPNGPGYYFDSDNNGDVTDNFGDNGDAADPLFYLALDPFCFSVTVTNTTTCPATTSYTPVIQVSGDGDGGSWTNGGCEGDNASFSPSTSGPNNNGSIILPVELLEFYGSTMKHSNMIKWSTASEQNSSHFMIERSTNGITWNAIGKETARGYSTGKESYDYEDTYPLQMGYYRLVAVDLDGSQEYSNVISLERDTRNKGNEIMLTPNPARSTTWISTDFDVEGTAKIFVSDLTGKTVKTEFLGSLDGIMNYEMDLSDLTPGIYIVTVNTGNFVKTVKLVKE